MGFLGSNEFYGRKIVSIDVKKIFLLLCEYIILGGGRGCMLYHAVRKDSLLFLCSGFYYSPLRGALAIFSTGTYAWISTICVKSETCYEK